VAATLAVPASLEAQGLIQLEPFRGELGLGYDGRSYTSDAPSNSETQVLREWFGARFAGFVKSRNTVRFDLNLRPTWSQGWWSGSGFEGTDRGGRNGLYGDGLVEFFSGGPVSLSARVFRAQDIIESRFDQRTETDSEGLSFTGNFRSKYMNVNANYNENESDGFWTSSVSSFGRRNTNRKQFNLVVQNSKTRVRYQRLAVDDLLRFDDDYLRHQLIGTNDQHWGKGSNLRSRVNYTQQEGSGAVETLTWGQSVHLQHTSRVSTDLNYYLNSTDTPLDESNGWGILLLESARLSNTVTASLTAGVDRQFTRMGTTANWRFMPRAQVTRMLPAGVLFSGGGGVGYQYRSQVSDEDGFGTAVGERHVVPPPLRFLLNVPSADPTSVRVTSEDASIVYELGPDYRLFESGLFLEVIVEPGGRIQEGQVVLVDYRFALMPTADGGIVRWEYNVNFSVKGFQLYHSLSGDEKTGQTETEIPLFGETSMAVAGIRFDSPTPAGALSLNGEWRRTAYDRRASELISFNGNLGFRIAGDLRGSAAIGWSSRRDGDRWDIFRGFARVIWTPLSRLNVFSTLSANHWERSVGGRQRFVGATIGADWTFGMLTAGLLFEHNTFDYRVGRAENRFVARIKRTF
jgi:hypothetical protein